MMMTKVGSCQNFEFANYSGKLWVVGLLWVFKETWPWDIDGLVQDYSNSSALAMELL